MSMDFRIVVAGDADTGKTCLIHAAAFPECWTGEEIPQFPIVLPPTRLSEFMFPDRVLVTVIDTFSDGEKTDRKLQMANAVILLYNDEDSFCSLSTKWLPKLRQFRLSIPVIVARCMLKPRSKLEVNFSLLKEFPEVVACIGFSPFSYHQVVEVFRAAEQYMLHSADALYDLKRQKMTLRCEWALKRIFILSDKDRDSLLSDKELSDLQDKCFDRPIDITVVKRTILGRCQDAFNEKGLTLRGFLIMNELLIEQKHTRMIWTMFRKFGYRKSSSDDGWWLPSIKITPHQIVELSSEAVKYLRGVFSSFERIPLSSPYSIFHNLPMDDFMSKWAAMALLEPVNCVENIIHLGYAGDPSSLVRVTPGRSVDHKKGLSDRIFFQCFVFGPKEAGKSSLLQSFVGRPFSETYTPTTRMELKYEAKSVDWLSLCQYIPLGSFLQGVLGQKTLILREFPEDEVEILLCGKDALAACDVAIFVYDSSDVSSWLRAKGLLVQVASYAESTGNQVPCLIVAAKGDLKPHPIALKDSIEVSHDMGIEAPILVSTKLGELNNVFRKIMRAAEHPDQSIPDLNNVEIMRAEHPDQSKPDLEAKSRKTYLTTLELFLTLVSVAAAVKIVDAITRKKPSSF